MSSVWIYVDTNKEVGDKNHLKVFATTDAAERKRGLRRTIPKAWPLSMRFWNEHTGKHIQNGCDIVASHGSYVF